ncbi:hypothetical protein FNJ67_10015 [Escherichia coli]|nr:hypothetical protein FNJ67_10015 [Escherichia coli]QDN48854.1 hypothetical protein FNJ65_00485 [Escherichia coli]
MNKLESLPAGKYKNYIRDEIKYWRYTSYKGGEFPEGFTDEKFSSAIYNGRIFTMKRLHTLMLFLAVLFTGFNVEAASVKQALSCDPNARAEQPGACPTTYAYFHERRSLNNFHRDRVITFEQIAE